MSSLPLSSRPRPRILPVSLSFCVAQARLGANQPITNPRPTEPNIPRHLHTPFCATCIFHLSHYPTRHVPLGQHCSALVNRFYLPRANRGASQQRLRSTPLSNAVSTNPTIANFSTRIYSLLSLSLSTLTYLRSNECNTRRKHVYLISRLNGAAVLSIEDGRVKVVDGKTTSLFEDIGPSARNSTIYSFRILTKIGGRAKRGGFSSRGNTWRPRIKSSRMRPKMSLCIEFTRAH